MVLVTAAAAVACSSGGSTASSAPSPASGPAASTAASRPSNALPSNVTPAMIAMGDSIFHARGCRNCHGADAKGTARGPDLTDATMLQVNGTFDDFVRIITDGVPATAIKDASHTSPMPARGGGRPAPLTDDQIRAVAAYAFTLKK
jgi:mono/diheme cytochrome c family protein